MQLREHDRTSSRHQGWWLLLQLAAVGAVALSLVALSVSAAPASVTGTTSADGAPVASAALSTCTARIQRGKRLVDVYERYYRYTYRRVKGSKKYRRVVVRARRRLKVSCSRTCVRMDKRHGELHAVVKVVKKRVRVRRGNRIVWATKRVRVYVFQKCPGFGGPEYGGPVRVAVLEGSVANLDFGAFQRQMPISGTLQGFVPGGFRFGQDNQVELSRANLALAPTDVFVDDACRGGASAAIRTGDAAAATLDPGKKSITTILTSSQVTATVSAMIRLPLELRNDDGGCDRPYITTGYTEFPETFSLRGQIEKATGLSRLHLTSAPDPLDVEACLSPGRPTSPCNDSALSVPLPVIASLDLVVQVKIGG